MDNTVIFISTFNYYFQVLKIIVIINNHISALVPYVLVYINNCISASVTVCLYINYSISASVMYVFVYVSSRSNFR